MPQSYYDLLGVPRDASTSDIEAAYRERAKETHPDRSDAPDATERFTAVNRARAVLTDPRERARYDRVGHAAYVGDGPVRRTSGRDGSAAGETAERSRRERGRERRRHRQERTRKAGATGDGPRADGVEADGVGDGFEARWTASADGDPFERRHAAENRSRSWYRPGAGGDSGYRVSTRDDRGVQLTTERIGVAVATFALYPVFVASAFLPAFPLVANLLVGVCTLTLVVYLLSVPETGVLVFGGWTLLAPIALSVGGVGLLSAVGILAWAFCWVPFVLAVANLLFLRA